MKPSHSIQRTGRVALVVFLLPLAALCTGWLTIISQDAYFHPAGDAGYLLSYFDPIYGGTVNSFINLREFPSMFDSEPVAIIFFSMTLIQTPSCIILDTLLLPLTVPQHFIRKRQLEMASTSAEGSSYARAGDSSGFPPRDSQSLGGPIAQEPIRSRLP